MTPIDESLVERLQDEPLDVFLRETQVNAHLLIEKLLDGPEIVWKQFLENIKQTPTEESRMEIRGMLITSKAAAYIRMMFEKFSTDANYCSSDEFSHNVRILTLNYIKVPYTKYNGPFVQKKFEEYRGNNFEWLIDTITRGLTKDVDGHATGFSYSQRMRYLLLKEGYEKYLGSERPRLLARFIESGWNFLGEEIESKDRNTREKILEDLEKTIKAAQVFKSNTFLPLGEKQFIKMFIPFLHNEEISSEKFVYERLLGILTFAILNGTQREKILYEVESLLSTSTLYKTASFGVGYILDEIRSEPLDRTNLRETLIEKLTTVEIFKP